MIDHSQTRWFCGTLGNAGIVGTIDETTGERRLFLGGGPLVTGNTEAADEQQIASWGRELSERSLRSMLDWLGRPAHARVGGMFDVDPDDIPF